MNVTFGQDKTKYRGQRMKVATVQMNGTTSILGLSDTSRCAQGDNGVTGREISERVLRNLAHARGLTEWEPGSEPEQLQAHCRDLLGLKPLEQAE